MHINVGVEDSPLASPDQKLSVRSQKGFTKPKIARTAPKNFLNTSRVLPVIVLQSPRPPTEVPNARHGKQPKNSRKGCRVGHGKAAEKQPEKQPKHPKNSCFGCFSAVLRVFRLFFRLFFSCFTVTHSAPFSAVFRLFSMLGIWHLCRWPRRLQSLSSKTRGLRQIAQESSPERSARSLSHSFFL